MGEQVQITGVVVYLWCEPCQTVATVLAYDLPDFETCHCGTELRQIAGCVDCGKAVAHRCDDRCAGCDAKVEQKEHEASMAAALQRARAEDRAALIGIVRVAA